MPDSEPGLVPGDVVRVPFPYVDRNRRQHRPALVVSRGGIGPGGGLLWVVMITSAANQGWADDVLIEDHEAAGLPVASVIRPVKIATIETARAERVGRLPPASFARVRAILAELLAAGH